MVAISKLLEQIESASDGPALIDEMCYLGFSDKDKQHLEKSGLSPYSGKVRELVKVGGDLWIYHTDRLTAFDRYIGLVPFKGAILAKISEYWLQQAARIVPVHFRSFPHPRVICGEAMTPVKVEVVVRGYMAGSMARAYKSGVRSFCGMSLASGLEEFKPLPRAIITPTTKADAFEHDEESSPEELINNGVCTSEEWAVISNMALELFAYGQEVFEKKGWLLVDTKYEFGRSDSGEIKLIDEIHTPDSSRLWRKQSYLNRLAKGLPPEMLDKEVVRRYLLQQGFSGQGEVPKVPPDQLVSLAKIYLEVAESLTGTALEIALDDQPPIPSSSS